MSDLNAIEYKRFEDIKRIREDGSEYWSARELGPALDLHSGVISQRLLIER